jgi:hypothetical protein
MNPNKCAFGVSAGQFLGFLIHERGIEVGQKSISAIKNRSTIKQKGAPIIDRQNQFIIRFVSNLFERIQPFTSLLKFKVDQKFV